MYIWSSVSTLVTTPSFLVPYLLNQNRVHVNMDYFILYQELKVKFDIFKIGMFT